MKENRSSLLSRRLRLVRVALACWMALMLAGASACQLNRRAKAEKAPISKCLDRLDSIPMLSAVLKSRAKNDAESQNRPFEGMEIALTINNMIRGKPDPEAEIDSWCEFENTPANFDKIVSALKANGMPPTVSFVSGRLADAAVLHKWVESGNLVGNMTYSRKKARKRTSQELINDIARNGQFLEKLLPRDGGKELYFRFPAIKASRDHQTREEVKAFLSRRGYLVSPATIDAYSRDFNELYCQAQARGDQQCANLTKAHFKSLLLESTTKARALAKREAGHDVKQILLIEANQFLCDNLADIIAWYRSLGARFIPLKDALKDPFYERSDDKGRSAARVVLTRTLRSHLGGGREREAGGNQD
ncbi:MAG TPA: polysaccharide deacetylase family protein [Blastocatellia bacterium]|nr:polysaccharide deacetylase family protein [Blastocatellia bacterium]